MACVHSGMRVRPDFVGMACAGRVFLPAELKLALEAGGDPVQHIGVKITREICHIDSEI